MKIARIFLLMTALGAAPASAAQDAWQLQGGSFNLVGAKLPAAGAARIAGYQWLFDARSGAVRLCQQDAASAVWMCSPGNMQLGSGWQFVKADTRRADARFPVDAQFLNTRTGDRVTCVGTSDVTYNCEVPSV
jgi:hypothetical protein